MSYIVPRDKPDRCTSCPFMDKITYDCLDVIKMEYTVIEAEGSET